MVKLLYGKKTHKYYKFIALEDCIGKKIEAITSSTVEGAYGLEPCIDLLFEDGTTHAFVLPQD